MEQRITLVTLGVRDIAASTAFFEALGWVRCVRGAGDGVSFFQCGSVGVSLYPVEDLAKDAGVDAGSFGPGAFSIAHNVRSREAVDATLAEAGRAGAEIVRPAEEAFWGGYSGYFRDLDGHLWEVAWNPGFPLGDDGAVHLPD